MFNKKHLISGLMRSAETVRVPDGVGLSNELDSISGKVISMEGVDSNGFSQVGNSPNIINITSSAEDSLASALSILSMEGEGSYIPTAAQRQAMTAAAKYVGSKESIIKSLNMISESPDHYKTIDGRNVGLESLEMKQYIANRDLKNIVPSFESFDPQRIDNSVHYSMVVNFMCSRQDDFSEAFFPTITVDTINSGLRMNIESYDFVSDFLRETDGSLDVDKFNRRSLIKAQYDNELLLKDYNKIYPVLRKSENEEHFLNTISWKEKVGDEEVTTSPLLAGVKHNLLGLSQTDKTLASGMFNNTDTLDRRIELKNLYIKISSSPTQIANGQGTNQQVTATEEIFKLTTEGLPQSIFQQAQTGHSKDLTINLQTSLLGLNLATSKTADGKVSSIVSAIKEDLGVELEISISGTANVETGSIVIYGNHASVRSVRNSSGKLLDKDNSSYTKVIAALKNITIIAFDLNAGRTNSNLRTRGQRLEINRYTEVYPIPVRSDINVELPIDTTTGDQSDISLIEAQVTAIGAYCSAHAIDTIIKMSDKLRDMKQNKTLANIDRYEGLTVGRYYVDGYYYSESIDIAAQMDSRESNKRFQDVQRYLIDKLYNVIVDMAVDSKYLQAFNQFYSNDPSAQITAVIGTDPSIAKFLLCSCEDNVISLGSKYRGLVVSTPNPRIKGKIYVSFTIMDEARNSSVNPLNFGQMLWSPAIVLDLAKPEGGAYTRTVRSIPRYWHLVNLPIMAEFTIADTKNAFNKNFLQIKELK